MREDRDQGRRDLFDGEIEGFDLRAYALILWRHKGLVLGCLLPVLSITAFSTFTATPIYQADCKILVEEDEGRLDLSPEQYFRSDEFFQNQIEILKSRPVVEDVVRKFALDRAPSSPPSAFRRFRSYVKSLFSKPDPEQDTKIAKARFEAAVDSLRGRLAVLPIRNTAAATIQVEDDDPAEAARLANAIAESFQKKSLELKTADTRSANEYLIARLDDIKQRLLVSEGELKTFQEEKEAVSLDKKIETLVDARIRLFEDLERVGQEIAEARALHETLGTQTSEFRERVAEGDIKSLETLRAKRLSARGELQALERTYTPQHPEVRRLRSVLEALDVQIESQEATLLAGKTGSVEGVERSLEASAKAEQELRVLEARQKAINGSLERSKVEVQSLLRLKGQYNLLQREVDANQKLYESLLLKQKETGLKEALQIADVKIIEPAIVPRSPIRPRKALDLTVGFILGLILGLGAAVLYEFLDSSLKSKDAIEAATKLPTLATIALAEIQSGVAEDMAKIVHQDSRSILSEEFRSLRTNVKFAMEGQKLIQVTSSGPSEGKTTNATNLAIAFAQVGERVLIIDLDLRKPRIGTIFGISSDTGINKATGGDFARQVRESGIENLWVLAAGGTSEKAAEFLTSELSRVLALADSFDRVIVDTPPVNVVADAAIIAQKVSAVLYVVGASRVNRDDVRRGIETLNRLGVRVLGCVVNRLEQSAGGYYQYYRNKYYSDDKPEARKDDAAPAS